MYLFNPFNLVLNLFYACKLIFKPYFGIYQIGEDQARSCIVVGKSLSGATPKVAASYVDHLGVGISKTLK